MANGQRTRERKMGGHCTMCGTSSTRRPMIILSTPAQVQSDRLQPRRRYTEAEEIVAEANDFFALVERWIAASHPKLNA